MPQRTEQNCKHAQTVLCRPLDVIFWKAVLFCISDASLNHEAERVSIQPKGDVQLVRVVPHTCTFLCLFVFSVSVFECVYDTHCGCV